MMPLAVYNQVMSEATPSPSKSTRTTLRTLRKWVNAQEAFAMLTCYDASTAKWLARGGVRTLLVGDTAAEMLLGYDSTLPVKMDFMVQITAAVRRGAPDVLLMADMPFGSYQCGDDQAMVNASRFLTEGMADVVKLEVDASFVPLVERMSHAGIPVVAHIGSRPQTVRLQGGYRSAGRTRDEMEQLCRTAKALIEAGAVMLLIEAVPAEVAQRIVAIAMETDHGRREITPVIGCGAGSSCHGHVVVLHDLLGLTDWQPPFAPPMAQVGQQIQNAAAQWVKTVASGDYLQHDHPYKMKD